MPTLSRRTWPLSALSTLNDADTVCLQTDGTRLALTPNSFLATTPQDASLTVKNATRRIKWAGTEFSKYPNLLVSSFSGMGSGTQLNVYATVVGSTLNLVSNVASPVTLPGGYLGYDFGGGTGEGTYVGTVYRMNTSRTVRIANPLHALNANMVFRSYYGWNSSILSMGLYAPLPIDMANTVCPSNNTVSGGPFTTPVERYWMYAPFIAFPDETYLSVFRSLTDYSTGLDNHIHNYRNSSSDTVLRKDYGVSAVTYGYPQTNGVTWKILNTRGSDAVQYSVSNSGYDDAADLVYKMSAKWANVTEPTAIQPCFNHRMGGTEEFRDGSSATMYANAYFETFKYSRSTVTSAKTFL